MSRRDTKIAITGAAVAKMERDRARRGGEDTNQKQGSFMRLIFGIFPLLVIPVVLYNLIAMLGGGDVQSTNELGQTVQAQVAPIQALLNERFLGLPMISGVEWILTKGDAIVLLAVTFLFLEILKSTSTGTATIVNHGISLLLFILCLVQFLLMPNFATSTFFILMSMTLLDVLAGVIVTIVSARRDFGVGGDV
ncbi:MAG TPA: hypothetical protein PKY73_14745 [Hyphomonas sp.]|nr:hypothetical protein [Hyphomonas sp.]